MAAFNYRFEKHLREFEDFVRIGKDSRILDVAAGTGFIGKQVMPSSPYVFFKNKIVDRGIFGEPLRFW